MLMENLATLTTAVHPATRLSNVQEYYFSRKLKEVARLNAEGRDIISLAIGSPDMPPSRRTVERLCEVASQPEAHGYQPTMGTPELRQAWQTFMHAGTEWTWMRRRKCCRSSDRRRASSTLRLPSSILARKCLSPIRVTPHTRR